MPFHADRTRLITDDACSHVKRIALGVPEDKWDALFDEIYRVMKPGAAFEVRSTV